MARVGKPANRTAVFTNKSKFSIEETKMSSGNIVEIIGAVVDVQFAADAVPNVYLSLIHI